MFTKTTADGRQATITRNSRGDLDVHIDGALFTTGLLRKLPQPKGPATHAIGVKKALGLTATEAAELEQILTADRETRTAAHAATPKARRAELASNLTATADRWTALRTRAANSGEGWPKVGPAEQAMNTAQETLATFDAAHPALVAELRAEQAATADRNVRSALNA